MPSEKSLDLQNLTQQYRSELVGKGPYECPQKRVWTFEILLSISAYIVRNTVKKIQVIHCEQLKKKWKLPSVTDISVRVTVSIVTVGNVW